MQLSVIELLEPELIIIGLSAPDAKTTIQQLTIPMVKTGCVTEAFADDVWQRELTFPTGIPTQPIGIAIPHADPDHVYRSAMAIGILNKPVVFAQMGAAHCEFVNAKIVFLMTIKEKEKQVEMLQQLMDLIQCPHLLENIILLDNNAEIVELIKFNAEMNH